MYVIGTAGHVDHGKSTLVKALTGIDPDRLKEEKEREMTIDLGFAWLRLPSGREVSVVDVPGHERFIKNMLAGVGGIDLAMLVIAADEGVMPQTREHLAILDLLRVKRGLVAITKKDLVDADWLELVTAEITETLRGTALEGVPLLAVSAVTGEGLDELKVVLDRLLQDTPPRSDLGHPRLPIDRAFAMQGFGTVVTGTLTGGSLTVGQEVELVPSREGLRARIRGLQTHRKRVETAVPGSRVAVNLAGVEHHQVQRGEVLALPGQLKATALLDVHLRVVRDAPHAVRHNMGITFHTGTSEALGRLRLLDADELKPNQEGWAQLHLENPVAADRGDFFVLRSPQSTLGGGTIVDPHPRRHRRFQESVLTRLGILLKGSPRELLLQALDQGGLAEPAALAAKAGVPVQEASQELASLVKEGLVIALGEGGTTPGAFLISASAWKRLREEAAQALEAYHRQYPLRRGLPKEELRNRLGVPAPAFPLALARWAAEGLAAEEGTLVRAAGHTVRLAPEQQRAADAYVRALEREPFSPSSEVGIDPEVLSVLVEQGRAVKVSDSVVFAAAAYQQMEQRVVQHLQQAGSISVAQVRDMFGTSRKYALALLEHLDQRHITRRVGDERVLVLG
ncbi:MAG: selenocysteine-specific translation elongation factor [Chloroflexi bacterium]|nr:selenocysteine-specific translation elongation factor [Chloroflexota bacterium]